MTPCEIEATHHQAVWGMEVASFLLWHRRCIDRTRADSILLSNRIFARPVSPPEFAGACGEHEVAGAARYPFSLPPAER